MGKTLDPDAILPAYEREAAIRARTRNRTFWEEPALLAAVDERAPGLGVLDPGCGSGEPITAWFLQRGDRVTGVEFIWFRPEDAELTGHSVWLARYRRAR